VLRGVGGYRINHRLHPTQTTEVYEATGPGGHGRMVIRFLDQTPPMLPATKRACRAELTEVSKLRHPHIASVLSVDAAPDGVPFLVREHLDGQSLKTYLADRIRVDAGQTVQLLIQVALTLASAHRVRVFHRNLRPSQVFVRDAGGILRLGKLRGFGLWRLQADPVASAVRRHSFHYLAPEQLEGETQIDGRADQFALAAIGYRMLSGGDLFPGDDPGAIDGVDPALDAVIRRALARRAGDRFPSILAFATALRAAWPGVTIGSARV
jgi:serine/threonine protein kinase